MALTHGPIIGHTTRHSVKVWLRGEPSGAAAGDAIGMVDLYRDGAFVEARSATLPAAQDHTGVVSFDALSEGTEYTLRCDALPGFGGSPPAGALTTPQVPAGTGSDGRFRTAPATDRRRLRFAFGSCRYLNWRKTESKHLANGDMTFQAMLAQHQANPLDFVLMLGDQIYADAWGAVKPWPVKPTAREDYLTAYHKAFGQPHIRALMASVPTYMTLDDHEVFDAWPNAGNAGDQALVTFGRAAFEAYQHAHNPSGILPGCYAYAFPWGAFPFFVMDTRTGRVGDQSMLGPAQCDAFEDWLASHNDAPLLFVATSVGLFPDRKESAAGDDRWGGYETERYRMLEAVRQSGASPVVFLAGDVHNTHHATLTCSQDAGYRAVALTSSPFYTYKLPFLTANFSTADMYIQEKDILPPQPGGAPGASYHYHSSGYVGQNGFAIVEVDLSGPTPSLTTTAIGADGATAPGYPHDLADFCFGD